MFTLILMEPNLVTHEPEVLPEIHFADLAVEKKNVFKGTLSRSICVFIS